MKKRFFLVFLLLVLLIGCVRQEQEITERDVAYEESSSIPESEELMQVVYEEQNPVLKNVGIMVDVPNAQTKRAGDLLFDKIVVWEDGGSYSDKVFGEFGELGKRKDIPNFPGVEYNFAVPIGTKVYAAGDGVAHVGPIEHTQDWFVNIQPEGSRWFIGQEHIVNLVVREGDRVQAGDILGDATPNRMGYATTQLAVWTGGQQIIKYCPFFFLEESVKPVYAERLREIARAWDAYLGKDVHKEEQWVAPGCLLYNITEK